MIYQMRFMSGVIVVWLLVYVSAKSFDQTVLPSIFDGLGVPKLTTRVVEPYTWIAESVFDASIGCTNLPIFVKHFRANACMTWLKDGFDIDDGDHRHGSVLYSCNAGYVSAEYYKDSDCTVFDHNVLQSPLNQCLSPANKTDDDDLGQGNYKPRGVSSFLSCSAGIPQVPTEYDPWLINKSYTTDDCNDDYLESVYYMNPGDCTLGFKFIGAYMYRYESEGVCEADGLLDTYTSKEYQQLDECIGNVEADDYAGLKSSKMTFTAGV